MITHRKLLITVLVLLITAPVFTVFAQEITIDDVVRIKYIGSPNVSPDGKHIAFTWDDQGKIDLWTVNVESGKLTQITKTGENTARSVSWTPDGSKMRLLENGDIWYVDPEAPMNKTRLYITEENESGLNWAPDESGLIFSRSAQTWYRSTTSNWEIQLTSETSRRTGMQFSPDGKRILYTYSAISGAAPETGPVRFGGQRMPAGVRGAEISGREIQIMELRTGDVIWKYTGSLSSPQWMPDGRRILGQRTAGQERGRVFVVVDTQTDTEDEIWEYSGGSGISLSPSGDHIIMMRPDGNWDHIWTVSIPDKSAKQVTFGDYEIESSVWSPDGKSILFVSNEGTSGERHIFLVSPDGGERVRLTGHMPGTNINPRFTADGKSIVFTHAGPYKVSDIWIMEAVPNGKAAQLTNSMPPAFTEDNIVVPEEVIYKGALDWDIRAWLFKPKDFDPDKQYPAVVWVHGGPIRQMRYGWHPSRSYSLFYSYHQRLLQLGYVVLSVNFRGGIGFGRGFENAIDMKMGIDDVIDVNNGGKYLKSLPYVDAERVGVWGLSYGGYMTLHALGKHPGVFSMGINVAGVYNWATQIEIYGRRGRFVNFMGGTPEQSPEAYRVGSPKTYFQNINVPLLHLQGTADRNVPFSQMDEIVNDMVKYNKQHEVMYYPDQVHVFQDGDVWRHAFAKIEAFFEAHLKKNQ